MFEGHDGKVTEQRFGRSYIWDPFTQEFKFKFWIVNGLGFGSSCNCRSTKKDLLRSSHYALIALNRGMHFSGEQLTDWGKL